VKSSFSEKGTINVGLSGSEVGMLSEVCATRIRKFWYSSAADTLYMFLTSIAITLPLFEKLKLVYRTRLAG